LANVGVEHEAETEAGTLETGREDDAVGDARGRRWRMPNTGGTMRPEHGDEMGRYSGDDIDTIKQYLGRYVSISVPWARYCGLV
jgi:hypothetical protein